MELKKGKKKELFVMETKEEETEHRHKRISSLCIDDFDIIFVVIIVNYDGSNKTHCNTHTAKRPNGTSLASYSSIADILQLFVETFSLFRIKYKKTVHNFFLFPL